MNVSAINNNLSTAYVLSVLRTESVNLNKANPLHLTESQNMRKLQLNEFFYSFYNKNAKVVNIGLGSTINVKI